MRANETEEQRHERLKREAIAKAESDLRQAEESGMYGELTVTKYLKGGKIIHIETVVRETRT